MPLSPGPQPSSDPADDAPPPRGRQAGLDATGVPLAAAGRQATLDLQVDPPRLPRDLRPMLPRRGPAPFDSGDWLFDISWGGRRALVFVEATGSACVARPVAIVSAAGREITATWPSVARAAGALAGAPLILDGELVARIPRRRAQRGGDLPGSLLVAVDLLALEGRLLLGEPLHRRRALLEAVLADGLRGRRGAGRGPTPSRLERVELGPIVAARPVEGDGTGLFRAALAYGLPGIVAKRRDAPYLPGARSDLWRAIRASTGDRPGSRAASDGDAESAASAIARRRALHLFLRLPL